MQFLGLGQYASSLGMFTALMSFSWFGRLGGKPHAPSAKEQSGVKGPEADNTQVAAPATDNANPACAEAASTEAGSKSAEEVVAISAVMAILMSEGMGGRVTAVRQVGARPNVWALAGRRDLMSGRL